MATEYSCKGDGTDVHYFDYGIYGPQHELVACRHGIRTVLTLELERRIERFFDSGEESDQGGGIRHGFDESVTNE